MDTNVKSIVSMLASDTKITLYTATGEIIEMKIDGPYDTEAMTSEIGPLLTGVSAVDVDISKFLKVSKSINDGSIIDENGEGVVMVAIVDGKQVEGIFYPKKIDVSVKLSDGETVKIPDVSNLEAHMKRAAAEKSPSVANFFRKLAPVIKSRGHSAEDLMAFIKRSELPLTNDGRIIAYKRVRYAEDKEHKAQGYVVDCHTRNLLQRVGSRVTMRVDLVDSSRHNSCSTGLHVANIGYLTSFGGDATMIVLVDPANFIAVPHGETNKARVCSYDIIGIMSGKSHNTVNQGDHVTEDVSFTQMIKDAVDGNSMVPFEEIFVEHNKILKVEPIESSSPQKPKTTSASSGKSLNEDIKDTPDQKNTNLVSSARKIKDGEVKSSTFGLPQEVYTAFLRIMAQDSKTKIAKDLGTSTRTLGRWMEKHDYDQFVKNVMEARKAEEAKPEPVKKGKVAKTVLSVNELAQELYKDWERDPSVRNLKNLLEFKKAKKKSWLYLGFTGDEIGKIEKAMG